jgi:hypothetical protein
MGMAIFRNPLLFLSHLARSIPYLFPTKTMHAYGINLFLPAAIDHALRCRPVSSTWHARLYRPPSVNLVFPRTHPFAADLTPLPLTHWRSLAPLLILFLLDALAKRCRISASAASWQHPTIS